MTRVCVASDSTNQPVRNSAAFACRTPSITANVAKSNRLLIGPKNAMKLRMNPMSQADGRASISSSTVSVGIVIWLRVVEQVVEQDLRRQHRQERQERRRRRPR